MRERGIFYCAEAQSTVFAEKAYYVLLFLEGTDADIEPLTRPLTVFQVRISTKKGADLTRAPFDTFVERISSPSSYRDSQPLGAAMREAGIAAFRFSSARDPGGRGESRADRTGVQHEASAPRGAVDLHGDPRAGRAPAGARGDAVEDELRARNVRGRRAAASPGVEGLSRSRANPDEERDPTPSNGKHRCRG